MLIKLWYIDTIVMLTFIPWVLLVLQNKESSNLDSGGTLPGLCRLFDILFRWIWTEIKQKFNMAYVDFNNMPDFRITNSDQMRYFLQYCIFTLHAITMTITK